jgi:sugar/nucleoside kinase (ribokinase family)
MVVVVGALALDVVACRERFLPGTSNPADIRWAPGGVGFRIWRRLPAPKLLLTAVGDDPAGRWLEQRLTPGSWSAGNGGGKGRPEECGAARRLDAVILRLPQYHTACYSAFMESGRLLYGAADMRVIERGLTWKRVASLLPALGPHDLLTLEANLAAPLVKALIRRFGRRARAVFEGVSVEKLLRHEPNLRDLYLLCTNEDELKALRARSAPASRRSGSGWLEAFMGSRRIEHWLVGRGRRGARLYSLGRGGRMGVINQAPTCVVRAPDTTGAGDRLLAAVLARLGRGGSPEKVLPAAMREVEKAIEEGRL